MSEKRTKMSQSWIDAPLRKVLNSYCKQQSETQKKVMKTVNRWLLNVALAIVVAGSVAQAKAALSGTLWTDEEGFLSRMTGNPFFQQDNPPLASGYQYTDNTGYGYAVTKPSARTLLLTFTHPPAGPAPTGVGGLFGKQTQLTFTFRDAANKSYEYSFYTAWDETANGYFGGYTTDVIPEDLYVYSLSFSSLSLPSRLYVGLDTVIPEPSTIVAGFLLLAPFAVSTVRRFRKDR